jgi:hypothetical protein
MVSRGLSQAISAPFFAAASAGLFSVAVIVALAFWQRDNLKLLRSAATRKEAT